ncbi:O-antigen/teichoic acid export membrane protein [Anoxybacillus tepidamans]|uniref:O-antigen/teichoic acid export membrane protein n=1 Tax=Anoxybacteroides tepidamans TaxID=265948 RepID=A0A7W8MUH2_9BACL|nr:oligosaccharide flippase family protein [Anoxybacillus tepidamans]MBB5324239.1 O-antigen/teichoic acid export membrane protein [Anoxybacillus tepidamans]
MLSQIKRLGADSLLYAFMNVGTKLIAFIMLPVYTSFLSKTQYGIVDILDRLTSMLTFLVIFGTDSALSFYYYDTKDENKRLLYVQNVMYFRLFVVAILFLLVVVAGPWFAEKILENSRYVDLLYVNLFTLLLDTIFVVVTTVMRFEFQTKKVVLFTVLKMLLVAFLSYMALKFFSSTPSGLFMGRLVSSVVVFVLMLRMTWNYLKFRIQWPILKEILVYAAPLAPTSIAFWVISNSSTFFIQGFSSLEEVGVFGVALRLAMMITLVTSGVQMAWRPYSMSVKDKEDSPYIFAKIYMALLLLGLFGVMVVATVSPWVMKTFFAPSYYEAYQYVAFLSCVTFLNFYYLIISVGLFFKKETGYITRIFAMAALLNIGLNFALVPFFTGWGAVIANMATYVFAVSFIFRKSQQVYYVPVSFAKMAFLFVNTLISTSAIVYVQETKMGATFILLSWVYFLIMVLASRVDREFRRQPATENL